MCVCVRERERERENERETERQKKRRMTGGNGGGDEILSVKFGNLRVPTLKTTLANGYIGESD